MYARMGDTRKEACCERIGEGRVRTNRLGREARIGCRGGRGHVDILAIHSKSRQANESANLNKQVSPHCISMGG